MGIGLTKKAAQAPRNLPQEPPGFSHGESSDQLGFFVITNNFVKFVIR